MSATNEQLGAFSVSLNVKDLQASKKFYETLGFEVFHGVEAENWLIMKSGPHVIGLFQGMFEKNIMTFNPGWGQGGEEVNPFTDVREIQKKLKGAGIKFENECDENSEGPANFIVQDPDGNTIMFDQHR